MIRPTVSVVVPTRNRSGLLAMTLRSVLGQRGVDLEVIVVDEASDDDTADAIAGLAEPRIRVVHHHTPRGRKRRPQQWSATRLGANGWLLSMMTTCGLPTSSYFSWMRRRRSAVIGLIRDR